MIWLNSLVYFSLVFTANIYLHYSFIYSLHDNQISNAGQIATDSIKIQSLQKTQSGDELYQIKNWVARGGVWDFSKKIIRGQGTMSSRPFAYYKKENYSDFVYEIGLKSLCDEDGSYGMLLRFDEKKDVGYVFSVWPHGDYEFCRIENEICYQIVTGSADYLKDRLKTWNTLKVVCKGPQFTLYINDHLLVVAEDTKYKSGKVGFSLGHGPASVILYEVKTLSTL